MKNRIKKLFTAMLSLAIIATLCPMTLYAAGETTPAIMDFNNEYQAWLLATDGATNATIDTVKTKEILTKKSDGVSLKSFVADASKMVGVTFFGGNVSSSARPGAYSFAAAGDYLEISLPKKAGYDLKTVGVAVAHKANTYELPFDYAYSIDGNSWTNIINKSYTSSYVASAQTQYFYTFYETLNVPANAGYLRVTRNSNSVTAGSGNQTNPAVMGFSFVSVPTTNNDIIKITASKDREIINLMTSGMVATGNNNFFTTTLPYTVDGVKQYGLAVANNKEMVFNALDGYKITAVEADSYNANNASRSLSIKLGGTTVKQTKANAGLEKLSVTSEAGEDSFSIKGATANPGALYNISITMEKVVTGGTVDVHGNIPQQNAEGVASLGNVNYSMVDDAKDNGDGTYTNYTDTEQTTLVNNAVAPYVVEKSTDLAVRAEAENFVGLRSGVGGYAIFKAPQDAYIQNFDCYIRYVGGGNANKRLSLSVAESLDGPWIDVDSTWEYVTDYTSNARGVTIYRQQTIDGVKLNAKYLKVKYPALSVHVVLGAFKYDWTVEKETNTYAQSGTLHIGGTKNPYSLADAAGTNVSSVLADYTTLTETYYNAESTVTEEQFAAGGYAGRPVTAGEEVFRGVYGGTTPGEYATVQAPDDAIATKATFYFYRVGDLPDVAVWTSDTVNGEYTEVETTVENLGALAGRGGNHYIYAVTANNLKNARFIRVQLDYGSAVKLGAIDIDYTRVGMPCIFTSVANEGAYTVTATNYTVNEANCKLIVAQYDTDNKTNTLAGVEIVDNIKIAGRGKNIKTITPVSGADKISVMAIDAKTNKPLATPIVIYPGE